MTTELRDVKGSHESVQQCCESIMSRERWLCMIKVSFVSFIFFLIADIMLCCWAQAQNRSPIVLDMDGNGMLSVAHNGQWRPHSAQFDRAHAVPFDIDADGQKEIVEWLGPEDGLLCIVGKDGTVESGLQLFGTAGGFKDGYEKLAKRDTDGNGALERKELEGLSVWQDKSSNGICEPGEAPSLGDLGITRLETTHHDYQSSFVINGESRKSWDWWPSVQAMQ
jgi:hypothetical protein